MYFSTHYSPAQSPEIYVVEHWRDNTWEAVDEWNDVGKARDALAELEALGWNRLRVASVAGSERRVIYYGD